MTDRSRRRPWLAALLALVVSGLGHAYLRRWARAFGWYVVVTATLVFLVPDAAVDGLLAGDPPPPLDIAPALLAVAASVIDAYLVAVRQNRDRDRSPSSPATPEADATTDSVDPAGSAASDEADADVVSCPHCGRETDATFDFCQWCAEPVSE
ncbi:zinc ribbon domain-containing protein [Halorubrum sp. AD140]|uniref:zinc ribbon domain-containing protein n=1 Tax=Halorubrum sp. AD140 TaxID=3050073 RepID=UPI002ACC7C20|nr:zinc ribbon domain-containing protein [Halorubrum sp. AD140]MDZ5810958.1 zinc ribbon domain-containing protein [Halorubrum sp. AD140]